MIADLLEKWDFPDPTEIWIGAGILVENGEAKQARYVANAAGFISDLLKEYNAVHHEDF